MKRGYFAGVRETVRRKTTGRNKVSLNIGPLVIITGRRDRVVMNVLGFILFMRDY